MKNNFSKEIILSLVVLVLLVLFINPFEIWMPDQMVMLMVLVFVLIIAVYLGFMWKENIRDEREALHRLIAARFAFMAGTAILVIGITAQMFSHAVDIWLVITLGVLMLAKIFGQIYGRNKY